MKTLIHGLVIATGLLLVWLPRPGVAGVVCTRSGDIVFCDDGFLWWDPGQAQREAEQEQRERDRAWREEHRWRQEQSDRLERDFERDWCRRYGPDAYHDCDRGR